MNFNYIYKNKNNSINDDNLCIVCWNTNSIIVLCTNCKFKYCNDCVKKVNGKCCICNRNKKKYNYFYDDDLIIDYVPNFYKILLGILFSFIIYVSCFFGIIFFIIILTNFFYITFCKLFF